ncbi:hypothetical protein MBLNU459_g6048t1 [Dothideomycetes sp. NU459]
MGTIKDQDRDEGMRASPLAQVTNHPGDPIQLPSEAQTSEPAATDISRSMGSTLWLQISEELSGMRSVLEAEEDTDGQPESSFGDASPSFEYRPIIFMPQDDFVPPVFESGMIRQLLPVLRQNVDPLIKVLHLPTFIQHVERGVPYLDNLPGSPAAESLKCAVFFACFCSMSNSETTSKRDDLRRKWRLSTEYWLGKADLSISQNIAAIRSDDSGLRRWMLISLGDRLAQSLLLHRESSYTSLSFFKAQIYRRTWHTMVAIDFHASFDHGTDPMLPISSFNTKIPLHIRDEDFSPDTVDAIPETAGYTAMTFYMIACECLPMIQMLSYVPAGDLARAPLPIQASWQVRVDAVNAHRKRLHDRYLQHCDTTVPSQFACLKLAESILNHLQLYTVRPLQRHPDLTAPSGDIVNVLLCATEALEAKTNLSAHDTEFFHWHIANYVGWHALAIVLAELCVEHNDVELVKRAWRIVDKCFVQIGRQIAGGLKGSLWKSILKLMKCAQSRKASCQSLATEPGRIPPSEQAARAPEPERPEADYIAPVNDNWNADFSQITNDSWLNWQSFIDDIAHSNDTDVSPLGLGLYEEVWCAT